MKHLDLFSGIGGFALAVKWLGIQTSHFVEIDPYCQKVLAKNFPGTPIHDDITTFTAHPGEYDLITGGFPCQDISSANPNGRGLEGERSGLFYELMRIIRQCRPRYVLLENVANLLSGRAGRDMGAVLWELSQCGYDAEWQVISAASVGAPHLRKRVFIIAYRTCQRLENWECSPVLQEAIGAVEGSDFTANPFGQRCERSRDAGIQKESRQNSSLADLSWWDKIEPPVLRVDDGVPNRVDRIRGLGNAVVPQCAVIPLRRILEIDGEVA